MDTGYKHAGMTNVLAEYFLSKCHSGQIKVLHGDATFQTKVVIQFPDYDSAVNWYQSDAYQKIIPTRDRDMQSQFHLIG